ncbi:DUF924 domain-containing protein [Endozoicomonas sp. SM1973]|uniref:DUF924 domain-containing protein n=1 Tax=Spartinivicinus marinus TaxID=2994442 RepID=A0A853I4F7_9GAMM|nr:DUF924 family protein [Spartinivicinus marinus]MCX4029460.1 DUF924 domain-containing protein [Spartinivicinus marinus]NYZ65034.1 DUF924 domain-containing protein [Spartinivicinus marinus]
MTNTTFTAILDFWFNEITPQQWWAKDDNFDQLIKDRFLSIHTQAVTGELYHWRKQTEGRLAEVIIIDQFSRNIFRNKPEAFRWDSMALVLAQEAVALQLDAQLSTQQRAFLYMPYMHSESLVIHEQAVKLFSQPGLESNLSFELKHKVIIEQFGRYPHRNQLVGRQSTSEEQIFLTKPGSSF